MFYFRGMSFLSLFGISKKQNDQYSVRDINFTQQYLQRLAIAGETGSGKTTLLKMIAGWIQPDEGEILFNGERIRGPQEQLIAGRKEIAYLSQNFELRNNYRIHELLEYANELSAREALTLYKVCRIDHLLQRRTDQLSGGEKQRIALARLLTGAPRLLLMDEPFSNLDWGHKSIIKSVIEDIVTKLNITCMLVSHDAQDLLGWADTILVMKEGVVIQQGSPEEVYRKPINVYCAELFGACNIIEILPASSFAEMTGGEGIGQKWIVRPEQIQIAPPGRNTLKGNIQKVEFRGNHYTLEVLADSQVINVQSSHNNISIGDEINLSFNLQDAHRI